MMSQEILSCSPITLKSIVLTYKLMRYFSERSKAEVYLKDEDNRSAVDILFLDLILDEGTGFDLLC